MFLIKKKDNFFNYFILSFTIMSSNNFLLPFRDKRLTKPLSNIGLTITVVLSLVFLNISQELIDILFVYLLTFVFFLIFRANFLRTIKIILSASIIIFFMGLPSFFMKQGSILFIIPIGKYSINFHDISVYRAIYIWVRGFFSVSIITLYTTILTVQEFISALRSLFIPNILVTLILLILRYTPMLYEQGNEIKTAQELRGISTAPFGRRFSAATSRIGGTLIRSLRKGTEVYEGMILRGLENSEFVKRNYVKWLDFLVIPLIAGLFSLFAGGIISGYIG